MKIDDTQMAVPKILRVKPPIDCEHENPKEEIGGTAWSHRSESPYC
jgi:hypothetical protein